MGCSYSTPGDNFRRSCCGRRQAVGRRGGRPRMGGVVVDIRGGDDVDNMSRKEFYLPNTGLRFTRRQMERLDFKLTKLAAATMDGEGTNGEWVGNGGAADAGASAMVESTVERLVQRLVCAVGMLDSRFASKFLVSLDGPERQRRRKFNVCRSLSYLVRIDALSSPCVYPEEDDVEDGGSGRPTCILQEGGGGGSEEEGGSGGRRMPVTPQGFARVRLQGEGVETWAEFIGQDGYLRSDKVQEHFIHLLSKAASLEATSTALCSPGAKNSFPPPPPPPPPPPLCPLDVDESFHCGSPGKIVDPWTLHHIIRDLPPSQQIYYGPAKVNQNRFPDPRDFQISILKRSPILVLLISPLSPTISSSKAHCSNSSDSEADHLAKQSVTNQTIKVSINLGIGFDGWPQTADFPYRVPLGHINAIHYYQSALGGFYLVPGKPHSTLRCESPRSSVWLMSFPATELILLSHWCPSQSSSGQSLAAVEALLEGIQARGPGRKLLGNALSGGKDKLLKRVTQDLLFTVHLLHLEKEARGITRSGGIGGDAESSWNSPGTSVSMHSLRVLDSIIGALRTQRQRHLIFPRCNVVLLTHTTQKQALHHKESNTMRVKAKRLRPMPEQASHRRISNFWQNAMILSGNFASDESSSGSEDEDDHEEEDFLNDASHIESAIRCLHLMSSPLGEPLEEDREGEEAEDYQRRIEVEVALSKKWQSTLLSLVPTPVSDSSLSSIGAPSPVPSSIFSSRYLSSLPALAYSTRQLKYIEEVIRQMLKVRQITIQEQQNVTHGVGLMHSEGPLEELVYMISTLLDPLNSNLEGVSLCSARKGRKQQKWWKKKSSRLRNEQRMKRWKGNRNLFSSGNSKENSEGLMRSWSETAYFPGKKTVINKTVNAMIHDTETLSADLSDDNTFVYYLLKWLTRAKKEEEKIIQSSKTNQSIEEGYNWFRNTKTKRRWNCLHEMKKRLDGYMTSYLSLLYASSLENGIHLEEHLRHEEEKKQEVMSFGMWCNLVIDGQIFPDEGAYDACCKGWKWAQSILETVKKMASSGSVQIILTPKPGLSVRQSFSGPHSGDSLCHSFEQLNWCTSFSLPRGKAGATLPNRTQTAKAKEFLTLRLQRGHNPQLDSVKGSKPLHCYLRDSNPICKIADMSHRRGQYRGLGTPVTALIAMHKFSILQEISTLLPEVERQQVLDSIHRVSKVSRRRCRPQRRLCNPTGIDYGKYKQRGGDAEREEEAAKTNEENSNCFGTVNDPSSVKKGKRNKGIGRSRTSAVSDQHLGQLDDRTSDCIENLQCLCRLIMGQQSVKGTREIGLAHGVRNFAVLSCSADKDVYVRDSSLTRDGNANGAVFMETRDWKVSRKTNMEMVTKL